MRIRRIVWMVVLLVLACGTIPAVGQGGSPLRDVLLPEGCERACVLGIEPGMSTAQLEAILKANAVDYDVNEIGSEPIIATIYYAYVPIPNELVADNTDLPVSIAIDDEGAIAQILVPVEASIPEILDAFGNPTFVGRQRQSYIVGYPELGLFFHFTGESPDVSLEASLRTPESSQEFLDMPLLQLCTEPESICRLVASPPATPTPTAPAVSEGATAADLRRLLSDPGCQAACLLGIEPGITTQAEVRRILVEIGLTYTISPISYPPVGTGEENGMYAVVLPEGMLPVIDTSQSPIMISFHGGIAGMIVFPVKVAIQQVIEAYGAPQQVLQYVLHSGGVIEAFYPSLQMSFRMDSASSADRFSTITIADPRSLESISATEPSVIEIVEDCPDMYFGEGGCSIATATPSGD